jgi:hypothetical protein
VAVSPQDPTRFLVGSRRLYEGKKYNDEGNYAWLPMDSSILNLSLAIHTIVYMENIVYIGTSSGIFYSTNNGRAFYPASRYLSNLQIYSMAVGNDGRIIAGTRENGSIYMSEPKDSNSSARRLPYGDQMPSYMDGGKSVFSLLKPDALIYSSQYGIGYRQASIGSDPQIPAQWYGEVYSLVASNRGVFYPRWYSETNLLSTVPVNSLAPPFVMWESINDLNSKDTVLYIADKNYAPGDAICAKSARNRYPIWITNTDTDTLRAKDSLLVHDVVTSRLFLGGGPYKALNSGLGAPVHMSLMALNYEANTILWTCVFRTKDTTEQVMDMVVSNDGDHLFILTKKLIASEYSIYRVSGFDRYRDATELDVSKMVYDSTAGLYDNNDRRMLVDDTLVSGVTSDILSIALDPQNNDHLIYTMKATGGASAPRIKLITNAQTATSSTVTSVDKEGSGIPTDMPVYTSLIEMKNANIAYAGTEKGIYKTVNFTSTNPEWTLYNNGIDIAVPVFQLYQQTKNLPSTYSVMYEGSGEETRVDFPGVSNYGMIYAATHGAGIFRDTTYWIYNGTNIPNYGSKFARESTLKVYPNPASSSFTIDYTLTSREQVQLKVVDITGKTIYTNNLGTKEAGTYSERLECSHLPNGFYFVNMIIGRYGKTGKIIISK